MHYDNTFHQAQDMTGEQKIEYIEKQMIAVRNERQNSLNCPYCDAQNIEGNPLCCTLFAQATAAIMLRWDLKDKVAHTEQILEKVQAN